MKNRYTILLLIILCIIVGCSKVDTKQDSSRFITLQFDVSELKDVADLKYTISTKK